MSTGGEVANALVCKTSIRGFNSRPVLQKISIETLIQQNPCEHIVVHVAAGSHQAHTFSP